MITHFVYEQNNFYIVLKSGKTNIILLYEDSGIYMVLEKILIP